MGWDKEEGGHRWVRRVSKNVSHRAPRIMAIERCSIALMRVVPGNVATMFPLLAQLSHVPRFMHVHVTSSTDRFDLDHRSSSINILDRFFVIFLYWFVRLYRGFISTFLLYECCLFDRLFDYVRIFKGLGQFEINRIEFIIDIHY